MFTDQGIEYSEVYIRGTAREPPDFVVSEVGRQVCEKNTFESYLIIITKMKYYLLI